MSNGDTTQTVDTPQPQAKRSAGGIVTIQQAVREGKSLEYKAQLAIPLMLIVGSDNPRHEPANLYRLGHKLIDPKDKEHSILHMALSDDMEVVKRLVALVEEHENDPPDEENEENVKYKEDKEGERREQSIVSLARSISVIQLAPVLVRKSGSQGNVTLIFGQRRVAAVAYWHAKTRVDVQNKVKDAKVFPPVVQGVEHDVTREKAFEMAVAENRDRKGFTDLQWGAVFNEYLQRKNPVTKKPYTLGEVAKKVFGPKKGAYGFVRTRQALMLPRTEAVLDNDGNVIAPPRGLTDEDRAKLLAGKVTVTWAVRKALGEQHYSESGTPKDTRDKPLPLKEMQKLFDDTAESNLERRKAIAECMGRTLEKAVEESEERVRKTEVPKKRGRKKGRKNIVRQVDETQETPQQEVVKPPHEVAVG